MKEVKYDDGGYGVSYSDVLDAMEFDQILHEHEEGDYQGDSYLLVSKDGRLGYLVYGWGSCSGCDAAQAVCSQEDANDLRDEIWGGIRWFDSSTEALNYFTGTDFELHFYGSRETFKTDFLDKVIDLLSGPSEQEIAEAEASVLTAVQNRSNSE